MSYGCTGPMGAIVPSLFDLVNRTIVDTVLVIGWSFHFDRLFGDEMLYLGFV